MSSDDPNQIQVFPAQKPGVFLNYNGFDISGDESNLINLTELWSANGGTGPRPYEWSRTSRGRAFIESLEGRLNAGRSRIWQSRRGRHGGGVWAHWQIALEYAGHLSVELRHLVHAAVREFVKEEKDPELKISRAIEAYRRKGKSESWIADRISGIASRNEFCSILASHGVRGDGFRMISSEINSKILGMNSLEFRKKNQIKKSEAIRDYMTPLQLASIRLAEVLTSERISMDDAQGSDECIRRCRHSLMFVKYCVDRTLS